MRLLLTVLLFSSFVLAQDAPPPAPEGGKPTEETGPVAPDDKLGPDTPVREPEPAADAWRVTRPVSNPQGDAITLKVARDPSQKRKIELMVEQQPAIKMGISGEVAMTDSGFVMPFKFTKFVQMGTDMTAQVAQIANARVAGKLTADGIIRGESVTVEGFGPMGSQLAIFGYMAMPDSGAREAKVGEVWEIDMKAYAARFGQAKQTEGSVYQVFEAIEDRDGVKCARIRATFGIKLAGVTTPMGVVNTTVRGFTTDWIDMEGHLRYRSSEFTQTGPMGDGKVTVTVTGTVIDAVPTAPGCGCGAAKGCGCGAGCDSGDPCGCGGGDDAAGGACGCGE